MCGFIGFVSDKNNNENDDYYTKFSIYLQKLKNRGPDFLEEKKIYYKDKIIHIGFTRLAIQDLTPESNKIFCDEDFIILFNGEIYNFQEIKNEYLKNEEFETKSDTEVLFKMFKSYGTNIVSKLRGIFSIVFIDLKKGLISCIRDFTGTKPLYYSKIKNNFFFSSEAWFLYSVSNKEIDRESLNYFFNFGFPREDKTLIKNVNKVKPRNLLKIHLNQSSINEECYFNLEQNKTDKLPDQNDIDNLVSNSIKSNLISDAKVGTFLSGGVDSTITTLIAKQNNNNVEAFTTFFLPEKKYEKFNVDYKFANKISKDFNIKLNTHYVENENDLLKDFYKVADYMEEPISNLNFLNTYWQSKLAYNNGFKVVLTGDGSDELFCGYDRYHKISLANKLKKFSFLNNKLKKYNNLRSNEIPLFFYSNFKNFEKLNIFKIKFSQKDLINNDYYENTSFEDSVDYINYFDTRYWLTNESNYKLDKCTMINSVEARVPFQDIKLFQKLFFIKNKMKIKFFNRKFLLKKSDLLPNYIKKRRKMGWFSPERIFLDLNLEKIIKKFFKEEDIKKQNIFEYSELISFLNSYHQKGFIIKKEIITILLFQIWYNKILSL